MIPAITQRLDRNLQVFGQLFAGDLKVRPNTGEDGRVVENGNPGFHFLVLACCALKWSATAWSQAIGSTKIVDRLSRAIGTLC